MVEPGYTTPFGKREWYDVSDYVVHFTKDVPDGPKASSVLLSILGGQSLTPGPTAYGQARGIDAVAESQRSVCFSEVPLGFLGRLAERRGTCYGIAFSKTFIGEHGGAPVWYLPGNKAVDMAFHEAKVAAMTGGVDPEDPIWKLTPFVDSVTPQYHFDWEREWRHPGVLKFEREDVAFLLFKEDMHATVRSFFETVHAEQSGPPYFCPLIDPHWSVERIVEGTSPEP